MSAIGIDLGTTTTLISVAVAGRDPGTVDASTLKIPQQTGAGKPTTLTVLTSVAYFPEDDEPIVGLKAKEFGPQAAPQRTVRAVKRLMGRQIILPYISKRPFEIAALYLEHALETARNEHLLTNESTITVTVPASFTTNQRRDTLLALRKALSCVGLDLHRSSYTLLSEPVAALLGFLAKDLQVSSKVRQIQNLDRRPRVLVYDLGGGTLDLTLVQLGWRHRDQPESLGNLEFKVLELTRYNQFGGEDFDRAVAERMLDRLLEVHPDLAELVLTDDERRTVQWILMILAERLKVELNNALAFDEDLIFETNDELDIRGRVFNFDWSVSRADYELWTRHLLEERPVARNLVHPIHLLFERLQPFGIRKLEDIDYFLVVGGMVKFAPVVERLRKFWGKREGFLVYKPEDQAVGEGAAVYSYLRATHPDFQIDEPAADAYYVRLEKGFDMVLGRRRGQINCKQYKLTTDSDKLLIRIFAGDEPPNSSDEKQLALVYPSLVYQGRVLIPLGQRYARGTPIEVEMGYGEQDEMKLPYLRVRINDRPVFEGNYTELESGNEGAQE